MLTSNDNNSRETRYNIQKYSNGERLILLNVTESHIYEILALQLRARRKVSDRVFDICQENWDADLLDRKRDSSLALTTQREVLPALSAYARTCANNS